MYDEARILAAHDDGEPVDKEQCLAIGDRLDTDIEAGQSGRVRFPCGVDRRHRSARTACSLRRIFGPTYIAKDLRGLNEPAA